MGTLLAGRGVGLVYGGGSIGLMGEVADAALAAGGEVIGVIPEKLDQLELGHRGLSRKEVLPTMHARKARMAELSDGFVAMPGGYGTLEELAEVVTWSQLNDHLKPVGLLDVAGYWQPLLAQIDRMVADGFVRPLHRQLVVSHEDPAALLEAMAAAHIPTIDEWIGHEQADARK